MTARILAGLVGLACLLALTAETWPKPRDRSPSKLEKSCFARTIYVPCFIKDEGLSQQWDV